MDYRCDDRKKVGELRGDIGVISYVLSSSFRKPWSSLNCQILNQVVETQLFISLWNRYHQRLSDIELIQISAFSSFLFHDEPLFYCSKANRGLKLSRYSRTPENDHVYIYSLWFFYGFEGNEETRWWYILFTFYWKCVAIFPCQFFFERSEYYLWNGFLECETFLISSKHDPCRDGEMIPGYIVHDTRDRSSIHASLR